MRPVRDIPSKEGTYFPALDGLRLLASLNIVLCHLIPYGAFSEVKKTFVGKMILDGPALHSSLFFLLSGYIFYRKYSQHPIPYFTLLKSRMLRLYPLHLMTTLFVAAIALIKWGWSLKWLSSLGAHLGLIFAFDPDSFYSLNEPSWALSAFVLPFVLFPWLRIFFKKMNPVGIVLFWCFWLWLSWQWVHFAMTFPLTTANTRFFHVFAPWRLVEFMVGMSIGRWSEFQILRTKSHQKYWTIFREVGVWIILGVTLYSNAWVSGEKLTERWMHHHGFLPVMHAILIGLIARSHTTLAQFLSYPLLKKISNNAFNVFLIHMPLLIAMRNLAEIYGFKRKFLSSDWAALFLVIGLYGGTWLLRSLKERSIPKFQSPSLDLVVTDSKPDLCVNPLKTS